MATLSKKMSYRRQGSSGLIWADNMYVTDDGIFTLKNQNKTADVVPNAGGASQDPVMTRSVSVGSATLGNRFNSTVTSPATFHHRHHQHHKSGFSVVRWIKKTFIRLSK